VLGASQLARCFGSAEAVQKAVGRIQQCLVLRNWQDASEVQKLEAVQSRAWENTEYTFAESHVLIDIFFALFPPV
jgi:hypothetical protein